MTDREQFEKIFPVPEDVVWNERENKYEVITFPEDSYLSPIAKAFSACKIQNARWEAWRSRKGDPWDFAKPGMTGNMARIECFGGHLFIVNSAGKVLYEGWNGDNSRNGETKTWNENGGWE